MDFFRGWEDYQFGFGNLTGEHWLGKNCISSVSTREILLHECLCVDTEFNIKIPRI